MKKTSVRQNYIFNTLYQILSMIIPFFMIPYISRVLGAENIGTYGYVVSIVSCFSLVGSMGIKLYGQREIAYVQDDEKKRSRRFWEIFTLRAVTSILSFSAFFLFFILRHNQYSTLFLILNLELLTNIFDINWFFQGMERFKSVTMRNGLVKIISIIPIFLFVRTSGDLIPYTLIYAISNLIGSFSLWPFLSKYVEKIQIRSLKISRHLKPTFLLFLPQAAAQVYTVLDTTMLGALIADKAEVGYYEQAQKMIHILLAIIISLSTVMMPKIASCISKKSDKINYYMEKSFEAIFMLATPIVFGLIACANSFVPLFFGKGFDKTAILLQIMAIILLLIGLASIVGIQYLIPSKQQNKYTASVATAAVANIAFNLIFIPICGPIGAAIGTVIAESISTGMQLFFVRKDLNIRKLFSGSTKYLLAAVIMFIICELLNLLAIPSLVKIILQVMIGGISYVILMRLFKAKLFMGLRSHALNKISNILHKGHA